MRSIQFSKWDPSGNTTLFFPQDTPGNHAALAHGALLQQKLGGEQAGFVDTQNGSLIMAGGEFCVNATRCFGALLDLCALRQGIHFSPSSPRAYLVRVSGWPDSIPLRVTGSLPSWQVEATLRFRSLPVLQRGSRKSSGGVPRHRAPSHQHGAAPRPRTFPGGRNANSQGNRTGQPRSSRRRMVEEAGQRTFHRSHRLRPRCGYALCRAGMWISDHFPGAASFPADGEIPDGHPSAQRGRSVRIHRGGARRAVRGYRQRFRQALSRRPLLHRGLAQHRQVSILHLRHPVGA